MEVPQDFDLFIGGRIGTFKGISIDFKNENRKPIVKNIQNFRYVNHTEHEVTALGWGDPEEVEVLIGLSGQKVKIYDTDFKAFTSSMDVNCGTGSIKGISRFNSHLLTAVSSGHVKVWSHSQEHIVNTGKEIERMRHNPFNSEIIATGGKENDLKLWNLEKKTCTFSAKNVRHDMLELRVPVWVSDMGYLPDSSKVAVCSRYGHVRLYDPSTPQKRPVVSFGIPDESLTTMSTTSRDDQIVVGTGKGKITLVDFRKQGIVQHYKGAAGSIRAIACHKTEPYILSVGLDRCVLVHNSKSRALLRKVYVKSQLNCLLLRSNAFLKAKLQQSDKGTVYSESDDDLQIIDDDYDKIFSTMETVEEPSRKKRNAKKNEEIKDEHKEIQSPKKKFKINKLKETYLEEHEEIFIEETDNEDTQDKEHKTQNKTQNSLS